MAQRRRGKRTEAEADAGEDAAFDELLGRVGARIRELRRLQGLTLIVLEEFTGIDEAMLSKIEAGKLNYTLKTVDRIARGLGVPLYELFVPREQSGIRPTRRKTDKAP